MGNTMIEEVTALLLSIVTNRALVIDARGGGVFGYERPGLCFHRPLALDLEMLLPLFEDEDGDADPQEGGGGEVGVVTGAGLGGGGGVLARVKAAPADSSAPAYARYAELLACR